MLKQRVITAILLLAGLLALIFGTNPLWFSLSIIPVVILAGWEWAGLAAIRKTGAKVLYLATLLAGLAAIALWLNLSLDVDMQRGQQLALIASILWAMIFLWVQGYPSSAILWSGKPVLMLLGLFLLMATWVAIMLIVHQPQGQWLLLLAIAIVALADIGGYVAGNLFGRHKMAPVISPGKTWEGFVGGLLSQSLLFVPILVLLPLTISAGKLMLLILAVSLYSVLGDLFRSRWGA